MSSGLRRVFLTSLPKSGTHFLLGLLENVGLRRMRLNDHAYRVAWSEWLRLESLFGSQTDELTRLGATAAAGRAALIDFLDQAPSGALFAHHYPYDAALAKALSQMNYAVVFMIREPGDQIVSFRNHVLRDPTHKNHSRFKRQDAQETYRDLLLGGPVALDGESNVTSVTQLYGLYQGWLRDEQVHIARFRDLIGARGGGVRLKQLYEADRLRTLIGIPQNVDLDEIVRGAFNDRHTLFVRGRTDQWQDELSQENQEILGRDVLPQLKSFSEEIRPSNSPDWSEYVLNPQNLRRAWWMAERDLAEFHAAQSASVARIQKLEAIIEHVELDSQRRLALIRKLEARLQDRKEIPTAAA